MAKFNNFINIERNGVTIKLYNNGSIGINSKTYYDDEHKHSKGLATALFIDNDKDLIEYKNIDNNMKKKFNRTLGVVFDNIAFDDEHKVDIYKKLDAFGINGDIKNNLDSIKKTVSGLAYKLGVGNIDNLYSSDKVKKKKFADKMFNNDVDIKRDKITKFVNYYKDNGLNDFELFSGTLQDYGIRNAKDILAQYNDKIDKSFELGSDQFRIISYAKKDFMNLQEQIIEDAIEDGYAPAIDMPRFVAPTDIMNDEKLLDNFINPQKVKMIAGFNFDDGDFKSNLFGADKRLDRDVQVELGKRISKGIKIANIDTDDCFDMLNAQVVGNNGFSFSRSKEWALGVDSEIVDKQRAMSIAFNGLSYCNKLVECGILQTTDGEDFTFTSDKSREILYKHNDLGFNELANKVIDEHGITFEGKKVDINYDLLAKQKKDFTEYLDAQFSSYYEPQLLSYEQFKNDIKGAKTEEFQRFNIYSELIKSTKYDDFIDEYMDNKVYEFSRESEIDFNDKKSEIDDKWANVQRNNREVSGLKASIHNKLSDEDVNEKKRQSNMEFINMSAVKFDGIDNDKLMNWRDNVVKSGSVNEDAANEYIKSANKQAKDLVDIGIMIKDNDKSFSFKDNFAKEVLYKGYDKDLEALSKANRGVKRVKGVEIVSDKISKDDKFAIVGEVKKDIAKGMISSTEVNGIIEQLNVDDKKNNIDVKRNNKDISSTVETLNDKEPIKAINKKVKPKGDDILLQKDIDSTKRQIREELIKNKGATKDDFRLLNDTIKVLKQDLRDGKLSKDMFNDKIIELRGEFNNNDLLFDKMVKFDSNYHVSGDAKYVSEMGKVESKLEFDIQNRCLNDKEFLAKVEGYLEDKDIDNNKYFWMSGVLDSIDDVSKDASVKIEKSKGEEFR